MDNQRQPLIKSLIETFEFFKVRKSVGRMKTEHAVFIPSSLMVNSVNETEEFIKAAKFINKHKEFNCPVTAEEHTSFGVSGIEFVFEFSPETKFDSIISELTSRL